MKIYTGKEFIWKGKTGITSSDRINHQEEQIIHIRSYRTGAMRSFQKYDESPFGSKFVSGDGIKITVFKG